MADFLASMAESSRERVAAARAVVSEGELRAQARDLPGPRRLGNGAFLLIAEIKRVSPAAGSLDAGDSIAARAGAYERGGAGAISVLTEPSRFGGSEADLREAAGAVSVPVMRKDFLCDAYQVLEARVWGASGVLVIVKMLEEEVLREMLDTAAELGLFTLVECFDREDIDRAAALVAGRDAELVMLGVNTRDLRDLSVRPRRLEELADAFPSGFRRIAESGIESASDAGRAAELGYDGVLVGSALMRAADPGGLCAEIIAAGCGARGVRR